MSPPSPPPRAKPSTSVTLLQGFWKNLALINQVPSHSAASYPHTEEQFLPLLPVRAQHREVVQSPQNHSSQMHKAVSTSKRNYEKLTLFLLWSLATSLLSEPVEEASWRLLKWVPIIYEQNFSFIWQTCRASLSPGKHALVYLLLSLQAVLCMFLLWAHFLAFSSLRFSQKEDGRNLCSNIVPIALNTELKSR